MAQTLCDKLTFCFVIMSVIGYTKSNKSRNEEDFIMLLTKRSGDIIRVLIRFPQDKPVTTAIISDELHISSRSIQRELPGVEKWLTSKGFHFVRKRSVGLFLDEPEERRKELLTLLDAADTELPSVDDRRNRQTELLHALLFAREPIKSLTFMDQFGISEGTLTSDLNQIEGWFAKYHLRLVRRQGLGIFLTGSETARRQAVTSHLKDQKEIPEAEISESVTNSVAQIVSDGARILHLNLSDNGYLRLNIYLAYSVCRIRQGECITAEEAVFEDLTMEPEFAVAEYLMQQLRQTFRLPIIESETRYLAIFLTGIRIWSADRRDLTSKRDFDAHQITLALIRNVSSVLDIDFDSDTQLAKELGLHIQPAIGRIRAGIPIENPLLEDIQTRYDEVYQACTAGCISLSASYGLPSFPPSEVGFISIYFSMALDRRAKLARRISVIIVCPTGIGSSRLLAENLQKAYPDLDIHGTMSAFHIDLDKLAEEGIDLIISTVKLNTNYRNIYVSPLLNRQDRMLLDSKFQLILSQKKDRKPRPAKSVPQTDFTRKDVHFVSRTGAEIEYLLDHIRIGRAPVLQNRQEILAHAASLFADTPEMESHFFEIMKKRDQIADTYMKPFHALLLHGKSPDISHPCFGYLHLEPPIYENARIILGAIVTFIPEDDSDQVSAPIVSEIIGSLMEHPDLLKALREDDDERFIRLLEISLMKFYKETAAERLKLTASDT